MREDERDLTAQKHKPKDMQAPFSETKRGTLGSIRDDGVLLYILIRAKTEVHRWKHLCTHRDGQSFCIDEF